MSNKPDPRSLPCSPLHETAGLKYFARMTGKIRLHAQGLLWEELQANLGQGLDAACVAFLQINYEDLRQQVLNGADDEALLVWCEANGRKFCDLTKRIWNHYVEKLGWNDLISATLARRKEESGLAHRLDIQTIAHYINVDEGRLPWALPTQVDQ